MMEKKKLNPAEKRQADKLELAKRIRVVQEWILQDHTTIDIINQSQSKWNITERHAYRYLWAAKQFFIEKETVNLERKKAYYISRKKKLLRDMNPAEKTTAAGVAAINRVLDSMAKMEGVTTDIVKLIGDKDNPIHTVVVDNGIDYASLTEEELLTLKKLHDKAAKH